MKSEIRYYISIFFRRFHYFALIAMAVTAAGLATAVLLPTKYRADALLLVESPQIPNSMAASTVGTNPQEELQIIQNRLLTRNNLIDIANEFRVFAGRKQMFPDEVVDEMRKSTSFRVSTGKGEASLVTIAFEATRPETTAAVVSAYVTRVLDSNVELRTGRAEDTMQFFNQEKERLAENLAEKSRAILAFKNEHLDALPENLSYQLDRLDRLRDRQGQINGEIQALSQQRERLILVYNATGTSDGKDLRTAPEKELDSLRSQLATALTVYSAQNPKVRVLQNQIAQLEERVTSASAGAASGAAASPSILDVQLDEVDSRAELLRDEAATLQPLIEELQANVSATPANSIQLDTLQREYETIQEQYAGAVSRAATAATGERIELLSKGGRISVVSQPVVPREPASPNRPKIALAGAGAGILAGLGFVALLEFMNRAIRRPVDLTRALGIVPIATLPLMRTPRERVRRRVIVLGGLFLVTAGIVGGIIALHVFVAPLDFLIDKVISKLGF